MPQSFQKYHERWQQAMQQWNFNELGADSELTTESCVIFESAHSTFMGEGATNFPGFGDAICYYRYYCVPSELEPQVAQENSSDVYDLLPGLELLEKSWEHRRQKLTNEQLYERRVGAEQSLDNLLKEFIQQEYRTELSEHLREIVNHSLLDFELHEVFVLPQDLDALISFLGHPLVDYDMYEDESEAEAHAPKFDLNNPEHREALRDKIAMVGR